MITSSMTTSAKRSFFSAPTSTSLALLVVGLASGQTLAAEDHAVRRSGASLVARSGGFPTLEPRSTETHGRSPSGSFSDRPAYRVVSPGGLSGNAANHDTANHDAANSGGDIDALALPSSSDSSRSKMMAPLVSVASSLAIVLALFSALVWAGRKFGGRASGSKPLPASALTPLGHVMLDPRTKLLLVKCGRRVLVLSQTAGGITPLTEITHPDEVQELMANCAADAPDAFERTLREIELEPTRGFTDTPPSQANTPPSRRLFATA